MELQTTDGTRWLTIQARALTQVPVWKGNRVLDENHAKRIADSLNGEFFKLSMNPYRVVDVREDVGYVRYIIDGQHRASILTEYFKDITAQDFTVLVGMNVVHSEEEVIDLFKKLNTTKSIPWKEDPNLVANKYIESLLKTFNTDKKRAMIRPGKTRKPYMSVDSLRHALISKKVEDWKRTPEEFVEDVKTINKERCFQLTLKENMKPSDYDAINFQFALGMDDKFSWI